MRAALGVPAVLLAVACSASNGAGGPASVAVPGKDRLADVEASFAPAFEALDAAVEAGDDDLARRILAGILARRPPARLRELADGYERILDGRAMVRSLSLVLVSEPIANEPLRFRLVLRAGHEDPRPFDFHLPPGTLRRLVVVVSPEGSESRRVESHTVEAVGDLELLPGETTEIELHRYGLTPAAGALAVREQWTLELRSGEVRVDDEGFPAAQPPVAGTERTVLAGFLPPDFLEPSELARYVLRETLVMPPVMERAVRIDPARREEALDLLTPVVVALAEKSPDRVTFLAPALRWLARTTRPGTATDWAAWLEGRLDQRAAEERPVLDLPPRRP